MVKTRQSLRLKSPTPAGVNETEISQSNKEDGQSEVKPITSAIKDGKDTIVGEGTEKEGSNNGTKSENNSKAMGDTCNSVEEPENKASSTLIEDRHEDSIHKINADPECNNLNLNSEDEQLDCHKEATVGANQIQDNTSNFMNEIDKDISAILTEIEKDNAEKIGNCVNSEGTAEQSKVSQENTTNVVAENVDAFKLKEIDSDPDVVIISVNTEDDIIYLSDDTMDYNTDNRTNKEKQTKNTPKTDAVAKKKSKSPDSTEQAANVNGTASQKKFTKGNISKNTQEKISPDSIGTTTNPDTVKKKNSAQPATKYVINPLHVLTSNTQTTSNALNNDVSATTSQKHCNLSNTASKKVSSTAQSQPKPSGTSRGKTNTQNNAGPSSNAPTAGNLNINTSTIKISKSKALTNPLNNASRNNVSKPDQKSPANTAKAPLNSPSNFDYGGEITFPIDYNKYPKMKQPNDCIDVTLDSEKRHEFYTPQERNFIRWKLTEGWSLQKAQQIVKMSRAVVEKRKKAKNKDSSEEMPPAKRRKLNEVDASNVASNATTRTTRRQNTKASGAKPPETRSINTASTSTNSRTRNNPTTHSMSTSNLSRTISNPPPKNKILNCQQHVASYRSNANVPAKTTGQQILTAFAATPTMSTNPTTPIISTSNNSMVSNLPTSGNNSTISIRTPEKRALKVSKRRRRGRRVKKFIIRVLNVEKAKEIQKIGNGSTQTKITTQTKDSHESMVPLTLSADNERACVFSNQIKDPVERKESNLLAESNRTSNFLKNSQTMAGPITKTVLNDLNNSISNMYGASLHVNMQLSTTCTNSQPNQNDNSQSQFKSQIQSIKPSFPSKVAIVHVLHPITCLSVTQTEEIKKSILDEVDNAENINDNLCFLGCKYKNGGLVLICNNDETKNWLLRIIKTLKPFPNGALRITDESFLEVYICLTHIPEEFKMPFNQLLLRLEKQNAGLSTKSWHFIQTLPVENGENMLFSVDESSKEKIVNKNGKLFLNFGQISIKMKDKDLKTDITITTTLSNQQIYDGATTSINHSKWLPNSSSSTKNIEQGNKEANVESLQNWDRNSTINPIQPLKWYSDSLNSYKDRTDEFPPIQHFSVGNVNSMNQPTSGFQSSSYSTNTNCQRNNTAEIPTIQSPNMNNDSNPYQSSLSTNVNWPTNRDTGNGVHPNNYSQNTAYNNNNKLNMIATRFNQSAFGLNPAMPFISSSTLQPYNFVFSGFPPSTYELPDNSGAMRNSTD